MLEWNQIYNMDCIEGMKLIADNSVDLVIADPPYALGADKEFGSYARNKDNILPGYVEAPTDYLDFNKRWLNEAFRILKPTGSLYLVSGYTYAHVIDQALREVGFTIENNIYWENNFAPHTINKFVNDVVPIFLCSKNSKKMTFFPYAFYSDEELDSDGRKLHHKHRSCIWREPKEYWIKKLKTPNKLPLRLTERFLRYSTSENDLVVDCFSGSGQVGYCCKMLNRNFISFELCKKYCDFATARITRNQYLISPGEIF